METMELYTGPARSSAVFSVCRIWRYELRRVWWDDRKGA